MLAILFLQRSFISQVTLRMDPKGYIIYWQEPEKVNPMYRVLHDIITLNLIGYRKVWVWCTSEITESGASDIFVSKSVISHIFYIILWCIKFTVFKGVLQFPRFIA